MINFVTFVIYFEKQSIDAIVCVNKLVSSANMIGPNTTETNEKSLMSIKKEEAF